MNDRERLEQAEAVMYQLKSLTKQVPARLWSEEYRKLADLIHSATRDLFYLGWREEPPRMSDDVFQQRALEEDSQPISVGGATIDKTLGAVREDIQRAASTADMKGVRDLAVKWEQRAKELQIANNEKSLTAAADTLWACAGELHALAAAAPQPPELPPSCGPAHSLTNETLVQVLLEHYAQSFLCADPEETHARWVECRAEVLSRLAASRADNPAFDQAIADCLEGQASHQRWINYINDPARSLGDGVNHEHVGDREHQIEWVKKYDNILACLRSRADVDATKRDLCALYGCTRNGMAYPDYRDLFANLCLLESAEFDTTIAHAIRHGLLTKCREAVGELIEKSASGVAVDAAQGDEIPHINTMVDGRIIDVDKLLLIAGEAALSGRSISGRLIHDLKAISDSPESGFSEERCGQADPGFPVLVTSTLEVLDGRHRVIKARRLGRLTVNTFTIKPEEIEQCLVATEEGRK